jgi:serine/threonine-protein kinase HipA
MTLAVCPATLQSGYDTYSPKARKLLFDGQRVAHQLSFRHEDIRREVYDPSAQKARWLSLSGVQEKYGLVLAQRQLRLALPHEQSTFILKPIPPDFTLQNVTDVPANEHLTMQIARQIYDIPTAGNALVFFADDEPALLVKRFDFRPDGSKWRQEDFASLSGRTGEIAGPNFKYDGSYEDIAALIRQFLPAYRVEQEKFFRLLLFNYLFSNGDAHLKNFSILETPDGDFVLSPTYDLICTRLHVDDSDLALNNGLFKDDFETDSYIANAFYAYDDWFAFGVRIGIFEQRVRRQLALFQQDYADVRALVANSFLSEQGKQQFMACYESRLQRLRYSMVGS